jgi:hypothetical protein
MKQIEIYPENTSLHLGYKLEGEPGAHWQKRAHLEKDQRDAVNAARNFWRLPIIIPPLTERKALERQNDYQA